MATATFSRLGAVLHPQHLLVGALLLTACHKDEVAPTLPPETTVGANKAGCLLDGQVLVARDAQGRSGTSLAYLLGPTAATSNFSLGITDETNNKTPLLFIEADSMVLEEGRSYPFSLSPHKGVVQGRCFTPEGNYYTQAASGTLTITRVDRPTRLLAGRFEFTATDRSTGRQVRVTQGRFDYKAN